jgi:hypothetical protein
MSATIVAARRQRRPHAVAAKPACGRSQIAAPEASGTIQRQGGMEGEGTREKGEK